jgi:RNA polymerase sigma-70 factor (ECF subfamily)
MRLALAGAGTGGERAFLALVERYQPSLARVASFWCGQSEEIEALVNQTWSCMLQRLDRFDHQSSLKGWLCVTLIKLARQKAGPEADAQLQLAAASVTAPAVEPERFSPPGSRWEGHWRSPPDAWPEAPPLAAAQGVVEAAMAALPRVERLISVLRDGEGLSSLEVRRALDFDDVVQRQLLHQARSRIRAALEQHYLTSGQEDVT